MNAIALLKADHRAVEELFEKLGGLTGKSAKSKKSLVDQIVRALSVHASIEEQIFYPAVGKIRGEAEPMLEALEEHNVVKWLLDALQSMSPDDERFDAKVRVLKDAVMHHVEREEKEVFPKVRAAFDVARLNDMGNLLERAKRVAPTRPHPRAPDQPPANIVAGMGAAFIDRARDMGRAMLHGRGRKAERPAARATGEKRVEATATRTARTPRTGRAAAGSRTQKARAKRGRATTTRRARATDRAQAQR